MDLHSGIAVCASVSDLGHLCKLQLIHKRSTAVRARIGVFVVRVWVLSPDALSSCAETQVH